MIRFAKSKKIAKSLSTSEGEMSLDMFRCIIDIHVPLIVGWKCHAHWMLKLHFVDFEKEKVYCIRGEHANHYITDVVAVLDNS
jgi:hypothetical protein